MGFSSNFSLYFLLLLCILLSLSRVSGEGSVSGSDKNEFNGSTDNLGRGSKMFFGKTSNSSWGDLGSDFAGAQVFNAFFASLSMVLVSEIGDETFIIAALMAMRQPKSIVLAGALSALFIMAVLSTGLGRIVPNLISRKHTNSVATVLYAFFGLRLLYYAWGPNSEDKNKKEMEEVEEKLESGKGKTPFRRFFSGFCTPIFLELATNKNAVGVAVGAIVGHIVCTTLAVVGGSMLASKISQRLVATMGGILFLGFSVSSFIFPPL